LETAPNIARKSDTNSCRTDSLSLTNVAPQVLGPAVDALNLHFEQWGVAAGYRGRWAGCDCLIFNISFGSVKYVTDVTQRPDWKRLVRLAELSP